MVVFYCAIKLSSSTNNFCLFPHFTPPPPFNTTVMCVNRLHRPKDTDIQLKYKYAYW